MLRRGVVEMVVEKVEVGKGRAPEDSQKGRREGSEVSKKKRREVVTTC